MKQPLLLIALLVSSFAFAQSKAEIELLANARSLNQAVFVNKDSASLDRLFSEKLSYGHSSGKLETKQEAIYNITRNTSTYADVNLSATSVWIEGKTAVTRYILMANEMNKEGKVNLLKLHILLVWAKEKKGWRLLARQAVRLSS
jgi:hypothetical protein